MTTNDRIRPLGFDAREIIENLARPGLTAIDAEGQARTLIGVGARRDLPMEAMAVVADPTALTGMTPPPDAVRAIPWSHWRSRTEHVRSKMVAIPGGLASSMVDRCGLLPIDVDQIPSETMSFCHALPILFSSGRMPAHLRPCALLPICLVHRPKGPSLFTAFWPDDTMDAEADLGFGLLSPATIGSGSVLRRGPAPRPQLLRHVVFERGDDPLRTVLREIVGFDPDRHRRLLRPRGRLAGRLAAAIVDQVIAAPTIAAAGPHAEFAAAPAA